MALPCYVSTEWVGLGHATLRFRPKKVQAVVADDSLKKESQHPVETHAIECYLSAVYIGEYGERKSKVSKGCRETSQDHEALEEPPALSNEEEVDSGYQNAVDNNSLTFMEGENDDLRPPGVVPEVWDAWLYYWEAWKEVLIPLSWVHKYRDHCTPEYITWHDSYVNEYPEVLPLITDELGNSELHEDTINDTMYDNDSENDSGIQKAVDGKPEMNEETEHTSNGITDVNTAAGNTRGESEKRKVLDDLYTKHTKKRYLVHLRSFLHKSGVECSQDIDMFFEREAGIKFSIQACGEECNEMNATEGSSHELKGKQCQGEEEDTWNSGNTTQLCDRENKHKWQGEQLEHTREATMENSAETSTHEESHLNSSYVLQELVDNGRESFHEDLTCEDKREEPHVLGATEVMSASSGDEEESEHEVQTEAHSASTSSDQKHKTSKRKRRKKDTVRSQGMSWALRYVQKKAASQDEKETLQHSEMAPVPLESPEAVLESLEAASAVPEVVPESLEAVPAVSEAVPESLEAAHAIPEAVPESSKDKTPGTDPGTSDTDSGTSEPDINAFFGWTDEAEEKAWKKDDTEEEESLREALEAAPGTSKAISVASKEETRGNSETDPGTSDAAHGTSDQASGTFNVASETPGAVPETTLEERMSSLSEEEADYSEFFEWVDENDIQFWKKYHKEAEEKALREALQKPPTGLAKMQTICCAALDRAAVNLKKVLPFTALHLLNLAFPGAAVAEYESSVTEEVPGERLMQLFDDLMYEQKLKLSRSLPCITKLCLMTLKSIVVPLCAHHLTNLVLRAASETELRFPSVVFGVRWLPKPDTSFCVDGKNVKRQQRRFHRWLEVQNPNLSPSCTVELRGLVMHRVNVDPDTRKSQRVYVQVVRDEGGTGDSCSHLTLKTLHPLSKASESGDSKVCGEVEITFDKDGNFCVGENNPTSQQSQDSENAEVEAWNRIISGCQRLSYWKPDSSLPQDLPQDIHKYWAQRYRLFLKYDEGIRLDNESWYSVTPEFLAAHQAWRCRCEVVVDAMCGAGGNAIQLAKTCGHVIAIDKDPRKVELARHNAEVYGVADRIEFRVGNFFKLAPYLTANVVYLSPPWGGMEYLEEGVYNVYRLGGTMNCAHLLRTAQGITPNVALYLPRNSDLCQVIALAGVGGVVDIETNFMGPKKKAITAYFGDLAAKCF